MEKTWTVVGTSVRNGELKLRLANGSAAARAKVLVGAGHTDVKLHDLPHAMTQAAAETWLAEHGDAVPPVLSATPRKVKSNLEAGINVEVLPKQPLLHDELGFAASGYSREYWDAMPLIARQEICCNAALAAGMSAPAYPELETWLEMQEIFTNEDGTLRA